MSTLVTMLPGGTEMLLSMKVNEEDKEVVVPFQKKSFGGTDLLSFKVSDLSDASFEGAAIALLREIGESIYGASRKRVIWLSDDDSTATIAAKLKKGESPDDKGSKIKEEAK